MRRGTAQQSYAAPDRTETTLDQVSRRTQVFGACLISKLAYLALFPYLEAAPHESSNVASPHLSPPPATVTQELPPTQQQRAHPSPKSLSPPPPLFPTAPTPLSIHTQAHVRFTHIGDVAKPHATPSLRTSGSYSPAGAPEEKTFHQSSRRASLALPCPFHFSPPALALPQDKCMRGASICVQRTGAGQSRGFLLASRGHPGSRSLARPLRAPGAGFEASINICLIEGSARWGSGIGVSDVPAIDPRSISYVYMCRYQALCLFQYRLLPDPPR
ncbi:hypothetical protein EJ04DRAFT_549173 [Polyplosphaeria fusca]|uniref:Uncharacterized protein n=1 Tax=Polyplosphaeria fusca TaxID=682080 RepID=A0A9P4R5Y7_9PLEO|nr:hypothetical protein EJ04DRAFT_549173 [Polyplosphaeria fusca]